MVFHIVDWLPPDFGAVGQHAVISARELAESGRRICLVGLTTNRRCISCERFEQGGVIEIRRLSARRCDKTNWIGRLIWSLMNDARLIWQVIRDPRSRGAEILFTGSPPFMLFFAFLAKWLRGVRLVYRITDFYPEVVMAALGKRPLPLAVLERLTWFLRRRVDIFQVLGEDQRNLLLAGGIGPERIILKRDVAPIRISECATAEPVPSELAGRKVLLYSGNFGVAHEVDTVVRGFIQHHKEGSSRFGLWLNASGSGVQPIITQLRAAGIPVAHSDLVSLDHLAGLLIAADALLISLRAGFAGLVLPSKVYGCLASGRPILFVGPKNSDVHLLCTQTQGIVYEHADPGDIAGFARALERLAVRVER